MNYHPICANSPCSPDSKNINISSELIWEVSTLDWLFMAQNAPKIQRIWPNFPSQLALTITFYLTVINLMFWQVIYTFPNLSIDTHIGHNYGRIWCCHSGHYGHSAIMAVMAWPFMVKNMVDQYVYWKIGKIVDQRSTN